MIYFVCFVWAVICAKLADNYCKKNNFLFLIFSALGLVPLILIAGYRDITIGTDTSAYPITAMELISRGYDSNELLAALGYIEPLYLLIAYLSVQLLSNDVHSILIMSSAITIICFYIGFVRLRKYAPLWLSVFMFLFIFYNASLNAQRQLMAMSIVFLGFSYLINQRKRDLWIFVATVVIGFFIHKSAIVAILNIPLFYFDNEKYKLWTLLGCIAITIFYVSIFERLSVYDAFQKYEQYQQGEDYEGFFSASEFLLRIIFLYLLFYTAGRKKDKKLFISCKYAFICELCLNLLQIRSRFIGRTGYYLFDLYLIFIPYFVYRLGRIKFKAILALFLMLVTVGYWWYVYIQSNAGFTNPYTSKILGIN